MSILIFHRVFAQPDPLFPDEVDAAVFEQRLRWIRQLFNVIPLDEAVTRLQHGALPARAACITFDDGYADNEQVALPLLRRFGLVATFFVATGFIEGGRMWNDTIIESLRGARGDTLDLTSLRLGIHPIETFTARRAAIDALIGQLKYLPATAREDAVNAIHACSGASIPERLMLAEDQVRRLRAAGMVVGAHTVTHPILARTDESTARREISESKDRLQAILGEPVKLFAYPNGKPVDDYGAAHVAMVKSAGYAAAVSTAWGAASSASDLFQLPRFTPWDRTPARFGFRLVRNLRAEQG